MAALAHPTRRAVFERLRHGPVPVGEIAAELPVTRPAVSQHLRVLKDAGLVTEQRQGTRRLYRVRPEGLAELRAYLDTFWGDVLARFEASIAAETGGEPATGEE
jgi:DNA-binding transcriptional ArsR family regulator